MKRCDMHVGGWASGLVLLVTLAGPLVGCGSTRADDGQRYYSTSLQAVHELLVACRDDDSAALVGVFGNEYKHVYVTSDAAADRQARREFVEGAREKLTLQSIGTDRVEIAIGDQEWPLPIPLVREARGWRYDIATGAEEILNRRIGRNELEAIAVCRAVVTAEIYRSEDLDGNGVADYARRAKATPGNTDGLYWPANIEAGETPSPLHDYLDDQGDYLEAHEEGSPWRGYLVKLIERQGPNAPGGVMQYAQGENLTEGFAMLMWPSDYGYSGIMTLTVSHHGVVYERDLGDGTAEVAAAIDVFDPDESWQAAE